MLLGIWGIFYEDDMPFVAFFYAGIVAIVYWIIKRTSYYLMFRDKIFGNNQKGVSIGFIFGVIVALIWLTIISILYPAEDIANIVIVSLLISGLIFGFVGYLIQNYFGKKNKKTKKYTYRNYIEYLKDNPKRYWFKRKLYDWGWVPVTWQGWIVILAFIGLLLLNGVYLALKTSPEGDASTIDLTIFFAVIIILGVLILSICYKKGEKPKWTWGR